ncbi:hypothetical protein G6F43_009919 [Rhizopus delemar]|nr:hypothetical protein G6F43_009919 [Rhizopus delemar]
MLRLGEGSSRVTSPDDTGKPFLNALPNASVSHWLAESHTGGPSSQRTSLSACGFRSLAPPGGVFAQERTADEETEGLCSEVVKSKRGIELASCVTAGGVTHYSRDWQRRVKDDQGHFQAEGSKKMVRGWFASPRIQIESELCVSRNGRQEAAGSLWDGYRAMKGWFDVAGVFDTG